MIIFEENLLQITVEQDNGMSMLRRNETLSPWLLNMSLERLGIVNECKVDMTENGDDLHETFFV